MAKKRAETGKKKLLPAKEITVKSPAYGEHTRAARGSKTPISLNKALQANVNRTAFINYTAKRVHDLLKQCGEPSKEKMLWQVMLSRMRSATTNTIVALLDTMKGLDLNSRYPLSRFTNPTLHLPQPNGNTCTIVLSYNEPHIHIGETDYCFQMFLLLIGKEAKNDTVTSAQSEWLTERKPPEDIIFELAMPAGATYYAVCLHFMTGKSGKATGTLASRGMLIADVGRVR